MSCAQPLALGTLVEYWLGEAKRETAVEEHLFACAPCSRRLEAFAALARSVPRAACDGVRVMLTPALLERLERDGLRLRHHALDPGGRTTCAVAPDDDLVVSTLRADLRQAGRVALEVLDPHGRVTERFDDVPSDPASGQVVLAERGDVLRAWPGARG